MTQYNLFSVGVHELDRLAELDLTDNLIMKHSCLSPLKNLHHLSLVRYNTTGPTPPPHTLTYMHTRTHTQSHATFLM